MKRLVLAAILCLFGTIATAQEFVGGRGIRSGSEFIQNRVIFFNDTYFFGQNGFFDVGDNLRIRKLEYEYDAIREHTEKLTELVNLLQKQIQLLQEQKEGDGGDFGDPFTLPELPPVNPPSNSQLDGEVKALFTQRCASCHTEGSAKKITLLTMSGELAPLASIHVRKIHTRTTLTGEELRARNLQMMPQGGVRLPLSDRQLIEAWANQRLGIAIRRLIGSPR